MSEFIEYLQNISLPHSVARILRNQSNFGAKFPTFGDGQRYNLSDNRDWLASFWAGLLWLSYSIRPTPDLQHYVESLLPSFEQRLTQRIRLNHDVGFIFTLSARAQWQLTGNATAHTLALHAAQILAERYHPHGRYIQAWGDLDDRQEAGRFIIDCMMNLPLLWWAARETGITVYSDIACEHALTSLKYLVRPDFSTYHTYFIDPTTGAPLGPKTHQGYSDDSLWARGQAWAIYGFAVAAQWTGEASFLNAAHHLTKRYLAETDPETIPRWDFRLPEGAPRHPDSSAAAIAAAGMLRLAKLLPGHDDVRDAAARVLHTLATQAFDRSEDAQGLLMHGTQHAPKGVGIDSYTIFGDYFFLEALLMLIDHAPDFWGPVTPDALVIASESHSSLEGDES